MTTKTHEMAKGCKKDQKDIQNDCEEIKKRLESDIKWPEEQRDAKN